MLVEADRLCITRSIGASYSLSVKYLDGKGFWGGPRPSPSPSPLRKILGWEGFLGRASALPKPLPSQNRWEASEDGDRNTGAGGWAGCGAARWPALVACAHGCGGAPAGRVAA